MAKGQKRSNKEIRKPKKEKTPNKNESSFPLTTIALPKNNNSLNKK